MLNASDVREPLSVRFWRAVWQFAFVRLRSAYSRAYGDQKCPTCHRWGCEGKYRMQDAPDGGYIRTCDWCGTRSRFIAGPGLLLYAGSIDD